MQADHSQVTSETYRLIEQVEIDMASLTMQERMLAELMGGLFPEQENNFAGFTRVLDIACGSGNWVVSVARENPRLEATGIAHQARLVEYAKGLAQAQGIQNARFLLLAGGEEVKLPFPDNAFDLVNTQYMYIWLHEKDWPAFLGECLRITRPGGYLRMTEPEWGSSSSAALTRLIEISLQALKKAGHLLSSDDKSIAAFRLASLCQTAGWTEITQRTYAGDLMAGATLPRSAALRIEGLANSFKAVVLREGLLSEEEWKGLLKQISEEIEDEHFHAQRSWVTVCGRKPESA